jgi:hypothetical protein
VSLSSHIRGNVVGYLALFLVLTGGTAEALNGSNTVFSDDIVNGQVKTPDVGLKAVTAPKLGLGAVRQAQLANGAVTGPKLAPNAVSSAKVIDGSLTGADVQNDSLTGADVDETTLYAQTRTVSPVGTPLQNGQALRDTLAAITDASSTKPYLVKLEPGEYNVGGAPLQMKSFVDLEGSGSNATKVDSSSTSTMTLFVETTAPAAIRDLTIAAGGVNTSAVATQSDLTLEDDFVTAGGTGTTVGVFAFNGPQVVVQDSRISGAVGGSGNTAYGIATQGGATGLSIYDSLIAATANGAGDFASALSINGNSAEVHGSSLLGQGTNGAGGFAVIDNGTSSTVTIDASVAQGSQHAAGANGGDTILIGASKVIGGHDSGAPGTVTCVFSYKETYVATNATCD